MEEIGYSAFSECTGLEELTLPDSLKNMEYKYSWGCFRNCTNLRKVVIPKGLEEGYGAFEGCSNLNEIEWGEGITKVPDGLFRNCNGIVDLTLPDTIVRIGGEAFKNCSKLKVIKFSKNLEKIGYSAFSECTGLEELTLPDSLKNMEYKYSWGCFPNCTNLRKVVIPKGLEEGYGAFEGCSNLSEIEWGGGITKIPQGLFRECTGLKTLIIPDTVTEISDDAFRGCSVLKEMYFPNGINNIGKNVFNECPYLVMKMNRDTKATRYAIVNKMPFEWIGNEVDGTTNEFLNRTSSEYETITQGANANGYINFRVKYGFKGSVKQSISDIQVQIYIPEGVSVVKDTVKVNDVLSTNFTQENNFLQIPVGSSSGIVTFSVLANNYDDFYSFAEVKYQKSNIKFCEMISALNAELEPLSLHMDSETNSNVFQISGIAMPDNNIDIYVDGKKYTTLQGTKAGTYATVITIDDMKKYKTYEIKVSSLNDEGVTIEQKKGITYIPKIPKLSDFSMEHNGQKYSLLEQKDLKPIVVFNSNKQFEFKMDFENSEEIENVYVVSNRSNIKKKIEADWDEALQCFVAKGYFDDNNHSYVPGTITVEYIVKGETHYINENIDFASEKYVNSIVPEFKDAKITVTKDTESEWEASFVLPNMDDAEIVLNCTSSKLDDSVTETSLLNDGYVRITDEFVQKNRQQLKGMNYNIEDDAILFFKYAISPITDKIEAEIVDLRDKAIEKVTMGVVAEGTIGIISDGLEWADTIETWNGYRVDLNDAKKSIQNSSMSYAQKEQAFNRIDIVQKMNNGKVALKMLGAALSIAGYTANPAIGITISALTLMYDRELAGTMLDIKELSARESGSAEISFRWAIDPSGYVYDAETKERLSGVTITLYYKADEKSKEEKWDATEYLQQNPLTSADDGAYAWDVPEGLWQVRCEKEGYEAACSEWLQVPPPQLGINIAMKKTQGDIEPIISSSLTPISTSAPTVSPVAQQNPATSAPQVIGNKMAVTKITKFQTKSVKGEKIKVIWKEANGVSAYQVQYATDKKFKKKKALTTKKTSITIKKLSKKKTYYVRVRAYVLNGKKKVYGKWSKVKKVKIKK